MHPTLLTKNSYKLLDRGIQANPWGRSCCSSRELCTTENLLQIGLPFYYRFHLSRGSAPSGILFLYTSMLTVPSGTACVSSTFDLSKASMHLIKHTLTLVECLGTLERLSTPSRRISLVCIRTQPPDPEPFASRPHPKFLTNPLPLLLSHR